ncbi:MAG: tyrosine-type recombinase/integrase [Rhodanobacteraceae bacterium]
MRYAIDKARARDRLQPRREPYWGAPLSRGLFLGFRKLATGGTWIARYHDDGQHRYHSLGYVDAVTYDEAVAAARAWAKAANAGVDTTKVRTVADVCREYIEDRRREKGDTAANAIEGHFRRYVFDAPIGKTKLDRVRAAQVKTWRASLDMAPATRNRVLTALRAALNYAVASRCVDAGRAIEWRSVKIEPATSKRDLYLDRTQRHALIDALPAFAQPFVRALALLPLRPGALAQCTVADLHGDSLAIRHDKANAGRTIALSADAATLLHEQARSKLPAAPLLACPDGSAWDKERWRAAIVPAAAAAGLPASVCAYTLRHSLITDMLAGGMDSLTVARMAGTSLAMIEKTYGHLLQRHAAEAMQRLAL